MYDRGARKRCHVIMFGAPSSVRRVARPVVRLCPLVRLLPALTLAELTDSVRSLPLASWLSVPPTASLRAAFLSQKQIVRIRELRIEQLAAEKERLEFERAQLAFDGASGSRPNLPDAGSRSRGGRSRGTTGSTRTDETPAGCIRPYRLGRGRRKAPGSKAGSKAGSGAPPWELSRSWLGAGWELAGTC